ncbi:homeobox transcription factor [Trichophyton equinum CBS 127.97]|uniref:Homeobox transcription factor n=1 Tax=Trichophyton equinum (strain ATCC MYA-4606 / CBS 127.97) TaxID=559882 RepID=F2Q030_TRIEC|nr:homeobox transcription factor [Trichophyton equinum CBS 127.97]
MNDSRQTGHEGDTAASTVATEPESGNNYSFLIHSNKTLTQDLPPKVDSKVYIRQRRRRTSPEDHAILEAEYRLNPKPDKATRASIVSRVSLGDKEVQIWFQNRRQNDRRKSKPLHPNELSPNTQELESSQKTVDASPSNTQNGNLNSNADDSYGNTLGTPSQSSSNCQCEHNIAPSQLEGSQTSTTSAKSQENQCRFCFAVSEPRLRGQLSSGKRKRADSGVSGLGIGELENGRRSFGSTNSPSLRLSLSFDGEAVVRGEDEKTPSPPKIRDSLRIAFSADGEAVVRTAGEPSPSPSRNRTSTPLSLQSRLRSLRRTSSAVSFGSKSPDAANIFGRSRDSRRWELYCDTDARSALSSPKIGMGPTPDGSGSARSSRRRVSNANANARILSPYANSLLPTSPPQKRKKLSRAVSSLGRLETEPSLETVSTTKLNSSQGNKTQKTKPKTDFHNGDSDKENWLPGTQNVGPRRRRLHPTAHPQNRVLQTSGDARREGNRIIGRGTTSPRKDHDKNKDRLSGKPSLPGTSSNQEEDLDCIQGLLSLSQGAWK